MNCALRPEIVYLWPRHIAPDRSATFFQRPIGLAERFATHLLTGPNNYISSTVAKKVSIHRAPARGTALSSLSFLLFCLRWISRRRSEISAVYTTGGATIFCGWLARKFLSVRWIAEFWDHPFLERNYARQNARYAAALFYHLRSLVTNRMACQADVIVCTGHPGMLRSLRVDPERIFVSPNGADATLFRHAKSVKRTAKLEVVYVGWVGKARGATLMFDTMEQLQSAHVPIHLTMIGPFIPHDEQWVLNRQRQVANSVLLTGRLEHVAVLSILEKSSLGLYPFPAIEELEYIHPIKVCEYMAMAVVPVCTNLSGIHDLVRDGVDGFFLKTPYAHELASLLLWAARHRDRIEEMSVNTRKRAREFRWNRIHSRLNAELATRLGAPELFSPTPSGSHMVAPASR